MPQSTAKGRSKRRSFLHMHKTRLLQDKASKFQVFWASKVQSKTEECFLVRESAQILSPRTEQVTFHLNQKMFHLLLGNTKPLPRKRQARAGEIYIKLQLIKTQLNCKSSKSMLNKNSSRNNWKLSKRRSRIKSRIWQFSRLCPCVLIMFQEPQPPWRGPRSETGLLTINSMSSLWETLKCHTPTTLTSLIEFKRDQSNRNLWELPSQKDSLVNTPRTNGIKSISN